MANSDVITIFINVSRMYENETVTYAEHDSYVLSLHQVTGNFVTLEYVLSYT